MEEIAVKLGNIPKLDAALDVPTVTAGLDHPLPPLADITVQSGATDVVLTHPAGKYGYSVITVKGDADLIPGNIKENVTILGVTGNYGGGGGGGSGDTGPVRFYDYDGTVLYSYSTAEFAALTAMPANPSHTGLTAQGWNWTLANAQRYVNLYGTLHIGQTYITSDEKTRIYITLQEGRLSPTLGICPNGSVVIDWGDNTSDTVTGTSTTDVVYTQHTYTAAGDYVIALEVTGTLGIAGSESYGSFLLCQNGQAKIYESYAYQTAVRKIELGSGVTELAGSAFNRLSAVESVTIPTGVTSIGNYALYGNCKLAIAIFPNGVTSIGTYAMMRCFAMKTVSLPYGVTEIKARAFYYCYYLTNISIPDSVTTIGNELFYYCFGLEKMVFPSSVTSFGTGVLYYCARLRSVQLSSAMTTIPDKLLYNCFSVESITIPDGVTSIGESAFYDLQSVFSVTIPEGVTSLGKMLFSDCYLLSEVSLPDSLTSIGQSTFTYCPSLTRLTIPANVTSIGATAFYNCIGVSEFHFLSETPPTITASTFNNCSPNRIIYVPKGCKAAYIAKTSWAAQEDYIVEET